MSSNNGGAYFSNPNYPTALVNNNGYIPTSTNNTNTFVPSNNFQAISPMNPVITNGVQPAVSTGWSAISPMLTTFLGTYYMARNSPNPLQLAATSSILAGAGHALYQYLLAPPANAVSYAFPNSSGYRLEQPKRKVVDDDDADDDEQQQ